MINEIELSNEQCKIFKFYKRMAQIAKENDLKIEKRFMYFGNDQYTILKKHKIFFNLFSTYKIVECFTFDQDRFKIEFLNISKEKYFEVLAISNLLFSEFEDLQITIFKNYCI